MNNIYKDECHIWRIDTRFFDFLDKDYLDNKELERYHSYKFDKDKEKFLKSNMFLKKILSIYLKIPTNYIFLDRTCPQCSKPHGKPILLNNKNLKFSLTYSNDHIMIAMNLNNSLGIDSETICTLENIEDLSMEVLNENEIREYKDLSLEEKQTYFFKLWTLKEAYTKLLGLGLNAEFNKINFRTSTHPKQSDVYLGETKIDENLKHFSYVVEEDMVSLSINDEVKKILYFNIRRFNSLMKINSVPYYTQKISL